MIEATVVMARCGKTGAPYGIRMEKQGNRWVCTWAFSLREESAKKEGFDNKSVNGTIDIGDDYPGCPHCGATGFVQCGACSKISCYKTGQESAVCPFCKNKMSSFSDEGNFDNIKAGDF